MKLSAAVATTRRIAPALLTLEHIRISSECLALVLARIPGIWTAGDQNVQALFSNALERYFLSIYYVLDTESSDPGPTKPTTWFLSFWNLVGEIVIQFITSLKWNCLCTCMHN